MNEVLNRKIRILKDYNNLCKHIDDLACDYGELFTKATRIAQELKDDVSPANHNNNSKVESFTIILAKKKEQLERAVSKKQRIDKALDKLGVRNKYFVRQVAIEGVSIRRTSKDLKLDYKYSIKLFKKLIERLEI